MSPGAAGVGHCPFRLRPLEVADALPLAVFYKDEGFFEHLIEGQMTEEEVVEFVRERVALSSRSGQPQMWWAVEDSADGHFIGTANLKRIGENIDRSGSVGCALGIRGRGIGKSLGWEMFRIAFEDFKLRRVESTCSVRNEKSIYLMGSLFQLHRLETVRVDRTESGAEWPSHVFYMMEDEYPDWSRKIFSKIQGNRSSESC